MPDEIHGGVHEMGLKDSRGLLTRLSVLYLAALVLFLLICSGPGGAAIGGDTGYPESLDLSLSFPGLGVADNGNGTHALNMEGYPAAREIGLPALPSRTLNMALPPGTVAVGAVMVASEWYEIPGSYNIEWGQQPLTSEPLPGEEPPLPTPADEDVYSSAAVFPAEPVVLAGSGRMRGISIAEVRVTPVRYYPASGTIEVCSSMSIRVDTAFDAMPTAEELASQPFDESVEEIVYNFEQARTWYEGNLRAESLAITASGTGDVADYMVIASEALATAVEPLTDFKQSQGLSVQVVTTEWLAANVSGVDLPERIRNYLADNYVSLGIDYVLLAGSHYTVPMRLCYVPTPNHPSASVYTDYYYSDLSGDWDLDDNGRYGELFVDDQPGGVDFFPEVYVGRIPTDDAAEMATICTKIADFQVDSGEWKRRALLLGAVNGFLLEAPNILPTYGSPLSEKIKTDLLDPLAYGSTTMYEEDGLAPDPVPCDMPLTEENVLAAWPEGYGIVNITAHGSSNAVYRKVWEYDNWNGIPESSEIDWRRFLDSYDNAALDDSRPSIVFSCACDNAQPTYSNNLMTALLRNGASATIGATHTSYYIAGWQSEYWGGNCSMSYMFWKYLLQDDYRVGKALRMCDLWMENTCGWLGNYNRANLYIFNLYGDPAMKLEAEGSPTVSGIDPASAWNMGLLNTVVAGSNFLDGARVMLRMEGQGDIEATNVSVESSTRISATFDIAGVQAGRWDVVVRNPDGQEGVLEEGFEASVCGAGGGTGLLMLGISLGVLSLFGSGGLIGRRRRRHR